MDYYNQTLMSAARALRYLSANLRPSGGQEFANAESCLQMANELEKLDQTRENPPKLTLTNDHYSLVHAFAVELHRNHFQNMDRFDDQKVFWALDRMMKDFVEMRLHLMKFGVDLEIPPNERGE